MNTRKLYQLSLLGSAGGAFITGVLLVAGAATHSTLLLAFGAGIGGLAFAASQIANHQRFRMSNALHRKLTDANQALRGAVSVDLERMRNVVESLHVSLEGVAAENRSYSSLARAEAIAIRQRVNRRFDEVSQVVAELRDAVSAQFADFNASYVMLEASLENIGSDLGGQSESLTHLYRKTEKARRKEFRVVEDTLNRAMTVLQTLERGQQRRQSRANDIEELLQAEFGGLQTSLERLAAEGESQVNTNSAQLRDLVDSTARTIRKDIAAMREADGETAASTRQALDALVSAFESDRAALSELQTSVVDVVGSDSDEIRSEIRAVTTALNALDHRVGEASGLLDRQEKIEGERFSAIRNMITQLRVAIEALPQETRDYQQLTRAVGIDTVATPVTGGWAATPGLLVALCGEILDSGRVSNILDLGSGLTSLWAALSLKELGRGRCISVDHIPYFADHTAALVSKAGASDYVDIHCAKLKPWSANVVPDGLKPAQLPTEYYDLSGISLGTLDIVVVDGPPGAPGVLTRYPALPAVADHLADGALILVDDTIRAEERFMIEKWKEAVRDVGTLTEAMRGAKFTALRFTRRTRT